MCLFSHRDVLPENLVKITPQILQKVHFWWTCVETWDPTVSELGTGYEIRATDSQSGNKRLV